MFVPFVYYCLYASTNNNCRGLTWILESTRKGNRENVKNLQKMKDKVRFITVKS